MNGQTVAYLRYKHKLTQKQLAELLGVAESTVTKIECGHLRISTRMKSRLLSQFDIDEPTLTKSAQLTSL